MGHVRNQVMAQGRYCNYCLDYMAATQELMKKHHKFHHQVYISIYLHINLYDQCGVY
jgi:hypothetical protein